MPEKTLNDLFYDTLKDIYFAERQILKTLPKLAKATKSEELKAAFLTHRDETEGHVERLQQVFEMIGKPARPKICEAIKLVGGRWPDDAPRGLCREPTHPQADRGSLRLDQDGRQSGADRVPRR